MARVKIVKWIGLQLVYQVPQAKCFERQTHFLLRFQMGCLGFRRACVLSADFSRIDFSRKSTLKSPHTTVASLSEASRRAPSSSRWSLFVEREGACTATSRVQLAFPGIPPVEVVFETF